MTYFSLSGYIQYSGRAMVLSYCMLLLLSIGVVNVVFMSGRCPESIPEVVQYSPLTVPQRPQFSSQSTITSIYQPCLPDKVSSALNIGKHVLILN